MKIMHAPDVARLAVNQTLLGILCVQKGASTPAAAPKTVPSRLAPVLEALGCDHPRRPSPKVAIGRSARVIERRGCRSTLIGR